MHTPQSDVLVQMPPVVTSNAGTHRMHFDCRGFRELTLDVLFGTSHTDHVKPTVLKLSECDTTATASFTDVVKFTGGTSVVADSTGFVIPDVDQNAGKGCMIEFQVDLTERMRYLMLSLTTGADTHLQNHAVLARLSRSEVKQYGVGERQLLNLDVTNVTQQIVMSVGPSATSDT